MNRKLRTKPLQIDRPPSHLSLEARQIWTQIVGEYEYLPSDALLTLRTALEAFDRAKEAREILSKDGLTIHGKNGMIRKHPCCEIEKNAVSQYLAAMRLLGFDILPAGKVGRPPGR